MKKTAMFILLFTMYCHQGDCTDPSEKTDRPHPIQLSICSNTSLDSEERRFLLMYRDTVKKETTAELTALLQQPEFSHLGPFDVREMKIQLLITTQQKI